MMSCDRVGKTSEAFEDVLDSGIAKACWDQVTRSQCSIIRRSRDNTLGMLCKNCVAELCFFPRMASRHGVDLTITDPSEVHWLTV
jgi:hypothetical protein